MNEEIKMICEKLALPDFVAENANEIYDLHINSLKYRYKGKYLPSASVYLVCRMNGIPRTLTECAGVVNCAREFLSKTYRELLKTDKYEVKTIEPIMFLSRVASTLNLKPQTVKKAQELMMKKGEICSLVGKDPMSRLGGTVYLSCVLTGDEHAQKDVARACGITEVTVRNAYLTLKDMEVSC